MIHGMNAGVNRDLLKLSQINLACLYIEVVVLSVPQ